MPNTVTLTAGHSETDPGAINGQFTESDIAVEIRNIVAYYLLQAGIPIRSDGQGWGNEPLNVAVSLVKDSAIAVEFHCNSSNNQDADGVEALANPQDQEISAKLCAAVADVLGTKVRGDDGGWKPENSGQHSRLAYVQAGGIILELFFITNQLELSLWQEKKWLVGRAIAEVLLNYVQDQS